MCIICQSEITEDTVLPNIGKRFSASDVLKNLLCNVRKFTNLDALLWCISFDESYAVDKFIVNNAFWHKSRHQHFNNDKLQGQARKRKIDCGDCRQRKSSKRLK